MYKFESDSYGTTVTMTVNNDDITWPELLGKFLEFLKGCGYYIDNDTTEAILEAEPKPKKCCGCNCDQAGSVKRTIDNSY